MAICVFWLLTYVGQGLDMAVGNRPTIVQVPVAQGLDYRYGSSGIKKRSLEVDDLLHGGITPTDGPHRKDLSSWLVLNDDSDTWSPHITDMLIEDIMQEGQVLQKAFFSLTQPTVSPAVLNPAVNTAMLYSEHMTSQKSLAIADPFAREDEDDIHQRHLYYHDREPFVKKRRLGCKHPRGPLSLPIPVCDEASRRTAIGLQEPRQSNHDLYADPRYNTAVNMKTEIARADSGIPPFNLPPNSGFAPWAFIYETVKLPGSKRSQIVIGRRSIDGQGESPGQQAQTSSTSSIPSADSSFVSQIMMRNIRGSIQYDIPQIGKIDNIFLYTLRSCSTCLIFS